MRPPPPVKFEIECGLDLDREARLMRAFAASMRSICTCASLVPSASLPLTVRGHRAAGSSRRQAPKRHHGDEPKSKHRLDRPPDPYATIRRSSAGQR